jgi:hypothetical protein
VHGRLEDWANADKLLGEASLIIENTDERTHLSDLHRVRGDLLLCRGDPIKGERSYREAISVALDPTFTIRRFLDRLESDKPVFLRQRQRHTDGLRKAGVPEG